MMKTRQMMLTAATGVLAAATLALASCNNPAEVDRRSDEVTIRFSTRAMSDVRTRSEATFAENAIERVVVFGLDGTGMVVAFFPEIENPSQAGVTLSLPRTVNSLKAIANPTDDLSLDYTRAAELDGETIDLASAPASPFLMSGETRVGGQAALEIELVRSVARIDVAGADGFEVTAVAVANTPSTGYVFAPAEIASFSASDYTAYPEVEGSTVYVGENGAANPTTLRVKGIYKGMTTAYTFPLTRDGQPIDIARNTSYSVRVTPVSDSECRIEVSIPEWEDVTADDSYIIDFGDYYSVDFHNHTGFTDGSNPLEYVLRKGMQHGLDIIVNSEHGGSSSRNATIGGNNATRSPTWRDSGVFGDMILGDPNGGNMWRWQVIRDYSWPFIARFNEANATTMLSVQGLEWNPPGHEHSSSGVITGQFDGGNNASAMAQFEYMFDSSDSDISGGAAQGWTKSTATGHAKSLEAAAWLQKNHRYTSWLVPAHPERQGRWRIEDYRDMNDAAPDVFVAFESIPGHQGEGNRGSYGTGAYGGKTRGGAGTQTAVLGNVWDAMLSEGRHFWVVANSDYHSYGGDFYPGEYQKTYISMKERTAQGFVDGLRSGNLFTVHGDLIDRLEFSVGYATMGQTFSTDGNTVRVRILVNDPQGVNFNTHSALTNPTLDHIDLIAGGMREKVAKGTDEYSNGTWNDVKVIARFDALGGVTDADGITSIKWQDLGGGLRLMEYTAPIDGDTYFRRRGTNHGLNTPNETDASGNPLVDNSNNQSMAFDDLWFYSNPVFVNAE